MALVFTIPLLLLIPIYFISKKLNSNHQISHPEDKGYKWGYFQGITIIVLNILMSILSYFYVHNFPRLLDEYGYDSDITLHISAFGIVVSLIFIVIGYGVCKRDRSSLILFTIFTFNPVIWVINYFYIKRRPYLAKK